MIVKPRIAVLYYSMYGNTYKLAEGVCKGITEAGGEPLLMSVPELLPGSLLESDEKIKAAKKLQKEVRIARPEDLEGVDGVIMGSPTRFGNMCSQMRNFWDQTGGLWMKGALINKPGGGFCCTATQHGGQETTLISMMFTMLHHGMLAVGVPYSLKELSETTGGGGPYGPSAVVGVNGDRGPTATDLKIARELGKRITLVAGKMTAK
jgi:NAD(P)H:quinone oxidoreductase type IV